MGEARNRGSFLDRMKASQARQIDEAKRIEALRSELAAEVQAQSKRIGMALGTTNLMAHVPKLAPGILAAGTETAVPTGGTELRPARVVLVGLDDLIGRLGMMECAVDEACPEHGTNPACECVSCAIRKACGMLWKGPEVAAQAEPVVTSGYAQVKPFSEPAANVPSASAVPAMPNEWPVSPPPTMLTEAVSRAVADLSAHIMNAGFDPTTDGDDCDTCEHGHCAGCEPDPNPDTDTEVPPC